MERQRDRERENWVGTKAKSQPERGPKEKEGRINRTAETASPTDSFSSNLAADF